MDAREPVEGQSSGPSEKSLWLGLRFGECMDWRCILELDSSGLNDGLLWGKVREEDYRPTPGAVCTGAPLMGKGGEGGSSPGGTKVKGEVWID